MDKDNGVHPSHGLRSRFQWCPNFFSDSNVWHCTSPLSRCESWEGLLDWHFRTDQLCRVRYGKISLWTGTALFRVSEENKPLFATMAINDQSIILMHLCSGQ